MMFPPEAVILIDLATFVIVQMDVNPTTKDAFPLYSVYLCSSGISCCRDGCICVVRIRREHHVTIYKTGSILSIDYVFMYLL
jgi:hypothetical protein